MTTHNVRVECTHFASGAGEWMTWIDIPSINLVVTILEDDDLSLQVYTPEAERLFREPEDFLNDLWDYALGHESSPEYAARGMQGGGLWAFDYDIYDYLVSSTPVP